MTFTGNIYQAIDETLVIEYHGESHIGYITCSFCSFNIEVENTPIIAHYQTFRKCRKYRSFLHIAHKIGH